MVSVNKDGRDIPKIKFSENAGKVTTPGVKEVYRLFSNTTGKMVADLIALREESFDFTAPITLFDPAFTWKRKTFEGYTAKRLLTPIYRKGRRVYQPPSIQQIRDFCRQETEKVWEEVLRFENPQPYYVDLSPKLWEVKQELLRRGGK